MAKGTKRKNPGVGVDFKRAKYKASVAGVGRVRTAGMEVG